MAVAVGVAAGAAVVGVGLDADENQGRLTAVDAACMLLHDGTSADVADDVMEFLIAELPSAFNESEPVEAQAAVDEAVAQGC